MVEHLHRQGIGTEYATFDGSTAIAEKRDWLAHRFLKSKASHPLFVDADLAFDRMLAHTRVAGLGAGFLLISRRCIEALSVSAARYRAHDGETVAGIFARIPRENERPWGEDFSFCRRWRDAGGEVFAYIKAQVWHCGTMRYGVPFELHLAAIYGHPTTPPAS